MNDGICWSLALSTKRTISFSHAALPRLHQEQRHAITTLMKHHTVPAHMQKKRSENIYAATPVGTILTNIFEVRWGSFRV